MRCAAVSPLIYSSGQLRSSYAKLGTKEGGQMALNWHRLCRAVAWQSSYVEFSTANINRVHKYIFFIGP